MGADVLLQVTATPVALSVDARPVSLGISGARGPAGLGVVASPFGVDLAQAGDAGAARGLLGVSRSITCDLRDYPGCSVLSGNNDDTTSALQWLADAQANNAQATWAGTLVTSETAWLAPLGEYGNNSYIGGGFSLGGVDVTQAQWLWAGASGFAIDDPYFLPGGPAAGNGPRMGVQVGAFSAFGSTGPSASNPTGRSTAAGFMRIVNPRYCSFRFMPWGFYFGEGLEIYGMPQGDAEYNDIDLFAGFWQLDGNAALGAQGTPARIGLDDWRWLEYGLVLRGSEDGSGKCNENHVKRLNAYNCRKAAVWITGYDSTGNPGVPDATQNGVLGGAADNTFQDVDVQAYQARVLFQSVVASATANTVVLGSSAQATAAGIKYVEYAIGSATDGYYVEPNGDIYASIQVGPAQDQHASILGYTAATRTVTIDGQWDVIPSAGQTIVLGFRMDGILVDSGGGVDINSFKSEQVTNPIRLTGVTSLGVSVDYGAVDIEILNVTNSGGNCVVIDGSYGPFNVVSAGLNTIVIAAGSTGFIPSKRSKKYEGKLAKIVSGKGAGQLFKVATHKGAVATGTQNQLTITAAAWALTVSGGGGVQPDATSVIQFLSGNLPKLSSDNQCVVDTEVDATHNLNVGDIVKNFTLHVSTYEGQLQPGSLPNPAGQGGPATIGVNSSGHWLTAGDVVRLTVGVNAFADTGAANATCCVVVIGLSGLERYPPGGLFPYALPGASVQVTKPAGVAITHGDTLCSTAANACQTNNTPPSKAMLGMALENALTTDPNVLMRVLGWNP